MGYYIYKNNENNKQKSHKKYIYISIALKAYLDSFWQILLVECIKMYEKIIKVI